MVRRKKASSTRLLIVVAVTIVVGIAAWFGWQRFGRLVLPIDGSSIASAPNPTGIDAGKDGQRITVSGRLAVAHGAKDPQLGIHADAVILFRNVEMFQWQEQCAGTVCNYTTVWAQAVAGAQKFHRSAGHENPTPPFSSVRFIADDIVLGQYAVDADLIAAQLPAVPFPVDARALPPNLAASFRTENGVLYAGGDAGKPQVGELRISYSIVVPANVSLSGVQHGAKLGSH